jgi:hypothetical protein
MARFHFTFRSSGMGETHYTVYDREAREERTVRVPWHSNVARLMFDPMPTDLLDAFNAWREEEHARAVAHISARYGAEEAAKIAPFERYTSAA